MAIIYSYPYDTNIQDNDAWIGTNDGVGRKTKQFTVGAVANYLNIAGKVSIGGQMSYKLTSLPPGLGEMKVIGGGNGTDFVDIEFLNISTNDLSGAQVIEFLDYLVSTGLLISHQNNPSTFGHYTVVAYSPTVDPSVYKLELGILGGNGKVFLNNYYDLSPLNLAGGTGSGVTTVDTSEGSFITLTPTTPTAGNVLITADLSATGTPDATTFLRGDNTWAVAGEVDGGGTTNYVSKWQDPTTLTDSIIYDDGVSVGIGTTIPSEKLDVAGDILINGITIGRGSGNVSSNTANGFEALRFNTIGDRNTAFGYQTLRTSVDDNGLTAIGYSALYSNNGGGLNTAVGYQALYSNTVANENTAVGSSTLGLTVGGGRNTAVGSAAMLTNVGGSNNLALGTDALRNATANSNTAVGSYSLRTNINGSNNVAVGKDSGTFLSDGTTAVTATTNGVFIGSGTSPAANGQNNQIVIGYQATGIGSNSVVIGNDSITKTLLKGNVGIGTTNPVEKLDIVGNQRMGLSGNTGYYISWGQNSVGANGDFARIQGLRTSATGNQAGHLTFQTKEIGGGTTPTERLRITDTGNVGIGTPSPGAKMHTVGEGIVNIVQGSNTISYTQYYTSSTGTSGPNDGLTVGLNGLNGYVFLREAASLILGTSSTESMRIDSAGNVGIGTTSPSQKLHVAGNIRVTGAYYDSNNSAGASGQVLSSTATGTDWVSLSEISGVDGTGTANYIAKWSDTDTITNSVIYDNGTNVGIGTTSPGAKLTVVDAGAIGNGLRVTGGGGGAAIATFVRDVGSTGITYVHSSGGNPQITFLNEGASKTFSIGSNASSFRISDNNQTGTNDRFVIDSSGNVGIGTTSPLATLVIQPSLTTFNLAGLADGQIAVGNNAGLATAPTIGAKSTSTNRLPLQFITGQPDGSTVPGMTFSVREDNNSDFSTTVNKPAFDFSRYTTSLMRINRDGNVGIGTTSPGAKLHVTGDNVDASEATVRIGGVPSFGNGVPRLELVENMSANVMNYGFSLTADGNSTNNLLIRNHNNSTVGNVAIAVDRNTSNVGIGTTSPARKLEVDFTSSVYGAKFTRSDATGSSLIEFANSAGVKSIIGYDAGVDGYIIGTASATNFVVKQSGNVGIGTTSPTQKLHVTGSIRIEDIIYDSSNSPGTAGQVLYKPTNDTIGWTNKDSITSIPTSITATPGGTLSLASNIDFVYFTWSGGSGTYTLNLPIASTHAYKIIRFVCDSTISANDKIHIQGSLGDTVDGGLFYVLNKPYNGVQVWSDGSQWIVIQAKAT